MLEILERLHFLGLDFITYARGEKGPRIKEWQKKPKRTIAQLRSAMAASGSCNVGIRLGGWSKIGDRYLVGLDVDIRDPAGAPAAHAWLDEYLPEWRDLPSVISGSGGESRHVYCTFAQSPTKTRVTLASGEGWSVDVRGNTLGAGCQNVWPGSLHPSGGRYEFERDFDVGRIAEALDDADLIGGHVPTGLDANSDFEALVFDKIGANTVQAEDDEDDLIGEVKYQPLDDFTLDQARAAISVFDQAYWDDRDCWRDCGMGLSHQFGGSGEAFALWCEFARQSDKFDERVSRSQWKSFKDKRGGITIRSIIQQSNTFRALATPDDGFDDLDDDNLIGELDDEDLIGDVPSSDDADMALLCGGKDDTDVSAGEGKKPDLHWEALLDRAEGEDGKKGAIKPTLTNFTLIVTNDTRLRGVIGHNEFTHETVQIAPPKRRKEKGVLLPTKQLDQTFWAIRDPENGDLWSDERDLAVRDIIEAPKLQAGWGMKISDRDIRGSIRLAGTRNSFHPIKNFLESNEWDGVPRAESIFIDYLGAPDNAYSRSVGRLMLVAAVARIYEPGHKFDYAVILEGAQGARKTTFIETLGMGWFCELQGDFHDEKKMVEGMQGAWIMEIPELSQFQKAESENIKAFISRKADKVRLAYERRAVVFPRQCIFIGSTNNHEYLKDDTGGRRFWPMVCKVAQIDTDRLREHMPQIWAEAKAIYDQMRSKVDKRFSLPLTISDPDALSISKQMQESRRVLNESDVWAGRIQDWVDTPYTEGDGFEESAPLMRDRVCGLEVWVDCLGFRAEDYTQRSNQLKMVKALDKLVGFHRHEAGAVPCGKFGKQRVWTRTGGYLD